MVDGVNAENKVERMIFYGKGVGRSDLEFNPIIYFRLHCISLSKVNHDRREINPFKSNPRKGLGYKNGKNSRPCSDVNRPPLLNPPGRHPFENPLARKPHISFGHEVVIFCPFLIFNDTGLWDALFHVYFGENSSENLISKLQTHNVEFDPFA